LENNDLELVAEALDGSQKAFRTLTERHQKAVFHIIFKIVRDTETANDLAQESFMKAYSALGSYRSEFRFSTWLYKIAANCSIDYLRKKRICALSLDQGLDTSDGKVEIEVADNSYNPETDLVRKQQSFSIEEAIGSLPGKYREVIEYRHKDDKSYEEIADLLSIPVGTVKARIFRARELLKKKLRGI
jgi:RNA polymerase sigma-70 factor (ECF subfamily)